MNQNNPVATATQYTLDGNAATMLRCENCLEWVPVLVGYIEGERVHNMQAIKHVCAKCLEASR